ncbi:MAG: hypothetical protein A2Y10_10225 [Planctomycetes bacterium GWF2_41_51]|nr:MAG: hypothetical protein A2Y10_10225 [Planctomycetes bacterium GWF2_41_51]HBG27683.1 hypothetical protein [Phycisphaerales bacterium]
MKNFILVFLCMFITSVNAQVDRANIREIVVLKPDTNQCTDSNDSWRYNYAAAELHDYFYKMSRSRISVLAASRQDFDSKNITLIGGPDKNPVVNELINKKLLTVDMTDLGQEGFIIQSVKHDQKNYLVLAGNTGVSTLYSVYDYLENFCDVGFFADGEYVPSQSSIVFCNVSRKTKPQFSDRAYYYGNTSWNWGLNKYFARFARLDEMESFVSWLSKKKNNQTLWLMSAYPDTSGLVAKKVYDYNLVPEENYAAGWPQSWDYPPEYRTKWLQDWFSYARKRGIKIIYRISDIGQVPKQFRVKHPDLPYIGSVNYEGDFLVPTSEEAKKYGTGFIKEIINLYGTDHLWHCTPYMESAGAEDPNQAVQVKLDNIMTSRKIIHSFDPQARQFIDVWDFTANPMKMWTEERRRKYIESMPDDTIIWDMAANFSSQYEKTGYFYGKKWLWGLLHGNQGDDQLFGNLENLNNAITTVAKTPEAKNLIGIFNMGESHGHNLLLRQMVTELSWNTKEVDYGEFIKKYCLTRYGRKSLPNMLSCTQKIIQAVYSDSGNMNNMYYQTMGIRWWPDVSPPFDDVMVGAESVKPKLPNQITLLKDAVTIALNEKTGQNENKLYENDMLIYTKALLGLQSNYFTILTFEAFKKGDKPDFEANANKAMQCLDAIEQILSTRPDYSYFEMIRAFRSVPGTNPLATRMMCQHSINDNYASTDNFEQMVYHYKPRMKSYFDEMRQRMEKSVNTLNRGDIAQQITDVDNNWRSNFGKFPKDRVYEGTTVQAIVDGYKLAMSLDQSTATTEKNSQEKKDDAVSVPNFNVPQK